MSARAVRAVVVVVCAAGIVGMIVGSVADNNGVAMTFGVVTAVAVMCQLTATAVTRGAHVEPAELEQTAAQVEEHIQGLVGAGADEEAVRELAKAAVKLGRSAG